MKTEDSLINDMENKAKIQHYVPRFYLKNFSIKKGKCFFTNCFDKSTTNNFLVDIRRIGCEKYFYDTSIDKNQLIEKTLGRDESNFNCVYEKILDLGSLNSLSSIEKRLMAYFIATQWIRTKAQRETIKNLMNQLTKQLLEKKLSKKLGKQLEKFDNEQFIKSKHIYSFKGIPVYADIILNKKWIIFVNKTKFPYWTSDHPINMYNPINFGPYSNLGLLCKGIQIYFPLNSQLSLCLCDPIKFRFVPENSKIVDIQKIIFQNDLQVRWSTRHVFSANDNFSLAEKIIRENPDLKEINRKRISIN